MNERIKRLAEQAGYPDYMTYGQDKVLERFAELIVRDCATKANATALDLRIRPELDAKKYVGDGILKCFGIEE
jgi:hypothetical protein